MSFNNDYIKEDDYFIEDSYTNEHNNFFFFEPTNNTDNIDNNLVIKKMVYDDNNQEKNPQFITYIDHPNINIDNEILEIKTTQKDDDKEDKNDCYDLNIISHIYFGSITVVGLYIIFKMLQRSK